MSKKQRIDYSEEARKRAEEAPSRQEASLWTMEAARAAPVATAMGAPRISLATRWEGATPASLVAVALAEAAASEMEEDASLHGYFSHKNQMADQQTAAKHTLGISMKAAQAANAAGVSSDKKQAADKWVSEARAEVARLAAITDKDVGRIALDAIKNFSGGHYKFKHYGKTKRRYGKTKRRYDKTKRRYGKIKRRYGKTKKTSLSN